MRFVATIATASVLAMPAIDAACTDSRANDRDSVVVSSAAAIAQYPGDSGSIRELIDGIRGANPIQCELLLQTFFSWSSGIPDRDVNAWRVSQRIRRHVVDAESIAWLGEQMRAADGCAARAAARMLGNSPSPAARTLLVNALGHTNPQVRRLAAVGIGMRSDSTLNSRLLELLRDSDAGVRAAVAWALGAVN